jgi:hypothetical protein
MYTFWFWSVFSTSLEVYYNPKEDVGSTFICTFLWAGVRDVASETSEPLGERSVFTWGEMLPRLGNIGLAFTDLLEGIRNIGYSYRSEMSRVYRSWV